MQTASTKNVKLKFPFEIRKVDPELNKELMTVFTGERSGFVQVGPKKYFLTEKYAREAEDFYNFQFRQTDIMVNTVGRCGTTWMQELVWLLANDLNFKKASESPLVERFPFLEFSILMHDDLLKEVQEMNRHDENKFKIAQFLAAEPFWKVLNRIEGPRQIKSHLPFSLLSPNLLKSGCKIIYLARHPKDMAVSRYYLLRSLIFHGYIGDFPTYWNYLKNNLCVYTPYFEHLKEAWSHRNDDNFLFVFYEEMIKDLPKMIRKVCGFLGKKYTDEELAPLVDHLKFENFRKNPTVNFDFLLDIGVRLKTEAAFVRQGKTGGWRDYFTEEMSLEADQWIAENLKGTDIKFPE